MNEFRVTPGCGFSTVSVEELDQIEGGAWMIGFSPVASSRSWSACRSITTPAASLLGVKQGIQNAQQPK